MKSFRTDPVRRLTLVAMASALAIATNYLLLPLQNVKLMDLIVFIAGYLAGPFAGAFTGILTWSVYGTINPNGFSFPVWIATMTGETVYGIAGGILGRHLSLVRAAGPRFKANVLLGLLAFGLTFAYDIYTSIVNAWVFGPPIYSNAFIVYLLVSLPFFIAHEASNLLFFALLAIPIIRPLKGLPMRIEQ
jgi:uncharacterized membrane protein